MWGYLSLALIWWSYLSFSHLDLVELCAALSLSLSHLDLVELCGAISLSLALIWWSLVLVACWFPS
ncbi:MAG: hypothetical protein MJE68_16705 [Proteobacteria bacterium]|nr:hypothetical protein [Pseudomonadota bacterium]